MLTQPNVTCTFGQTLLATCGTGHFWHVPTMQFVGFFLWLPAMALALTPKIRRTAYEKFYMAHHIFLLLIPITYWHSWHVWQYSYIGVLLWVYNKVLSVRRSKLTLELLEATPYKDAGLTFLSLRRPDGAPLGHRAGQFACLNVPEIDAWQWHPFTVSSAEGAWTHHIKAMPSPHPGDGGAAASETWTQQLLARAQAGEALTVRYHGPYGAPAFRLPVAEQSVLMYVGGIGVTPAISMLATWCGAAQRGAALPYTTMVWVVRTPMVFEPFGEVRAIIESLCIHCLGTATQ
jgi:predicted ferric reductase